VGSRLYTPMESPFFMLKRNSLAGKSAKSPLMEVPRSTLPRTQARASLGV
jgi:hypothetical protein